MNQRVNLEVLRQKAREALRTAQDLSPPAGASDLSLVEVVEELRIYQAELEIQNQELAAAQHQIAIGLAKYQALFSSLPLPALLVDASGFVVESNRQAQTLLGLRNAAALQHRSVLYFFGSASRAAVQEALRSPPGGEGRAVGPLELRLPGGRSAPFALHMISVPDEAADGPLHLMVLTDRSTEEALRESEHTFHSFADASLLLIWASGLDRLCFYFNRGWLAFTGRTLAQEFGNGWAEGVHPDDLDRCVQTYNTHFDQRRAFSMDYRLRRHDGVYRWIRDNGSPRYDAKGQFCGYIGHCLDIHDRVETENRLRTLSEVIEQSPESIVITDPQGRIEYVNPACESATGYRRDELVGRDPRIFGSGQTPASVHEALWQTLEAGQPWSGHFVNRRKDGSLVHEDALIAPIRDAAGEVRHFVAFREDVSEKQRIAQELDRYHQHLEKLVTDRTVALAHAKEAAEAASVAKSAFLANMSHEIRTPMNAVMMLAHLLRSTALNPAQHDKLQKIQAASEHLLGIINDILDLSKIEAGKLVLERRRFDLQPVLQSALDLVREKADSKGLALRLAMSPEVAGLTLFGDETRLRQALLNYLQNAVKFTERGEVKVSVTQLAREGPQVQLRFSVRDSGIGISPDDVVRLFQNFEQADNSMTRRFGGTGLGLAITRHLATAMGGEVGVESRLGQGSEFWFSARLEVMDGAAPGSSPLPGGSDPGAGSPEGRPPLRILVCEDEPINREILVEILHAFGHEVETTENGAKALAAAEDPHCRPYDLILMDMQMPVMDGLEATRRIRQVARYQTVPIIALTANAFEGDRQACLDAGMNDFVTKPVYPDILSERIAHWTAVGPA